MLFRLITIQGGNKHAAWLYAVVFRTRISTLLVVLLCLSFLVQPISQVYAAEEGEVSTEPESTPAESVVLDESDSVQETDDAPQEESTPVVSEAVEEEVSETEQEEPSPEAASDAADSESTETAVSSTTDAASETVTPEMSQTEATSTESESLPAETETADLNDELDTAATTTPPADTVATSTTQDVTGNATTTSTTPDVVSPNVSNDVINQPSNEGGGSSGSDDGTETDVEPANSDQSATSNDEDADEADSLAIETTVASTTPREDTVREISYLVTEENYYQFSKQSCVPVGDGTFHCSINNVSEPDSNSVVFTRVGDKGSQEIFIRTKRGEEEQITDNTFEDTAPQYDATSKQIVWQRNIDGRYQIILYDLVTKKESQLTFSRTNNMEPSVSLSGIVWQAWDGNDWEVMYYDGTYTDQITNNQSQDIGPTIEDGYILWSVPGNETQEARVYSLENKETLTVSGHEGGSIANPRFVLVYDTRFDNGDVVTQSFDPDTGIATPIAAKAAPEPIDIPAPDPIGEIRALIQNKSTEDDLVEKASTSTATTGTSTPALDVDADTLVLQADQTDKPIVTASTSQPVPFELDEYDLVITSEGVSTTSATSTQP